MNLYQTTGGRDASRAVSDHDLPFAHGVTVTCTTRVSDVPAGGVSPAALPAALVPAPARSATGVDAP